jgi:hypothetical protein
MTDDFKLTLLKNAVQDAPHLVTTLEWILVW